MFEYISLYDFYIAVVNILSIHKKGFENIMDKT